MTKKKKTKKWYAYEQDEVKNAERAISKQRWERGDYDATNITLSRDNPRIRKMKRESYELGLIGLESIREGLGSSGSYQDTVEWGKMGGRPKKWDSEKERKKYQRTKKKLNIGQRLTVSERSLLGLVKQRPGSYKYFSNRPATATERKRAERERKKKLLLEK